jgi:hypothetical protein
MATIKLFKRNFAAKNNMASVGQ